MRDLAALDALYAEVDAFFEEERTRALQAGDADRVLRIEGKQRLNDQAYFVLCWGQLEAEIDEACRAAIRRRRSDVNWEVRRAWDLYNPDDRRLSGLSFVDRVALVVDRNGGEGSPFSRIKGFYEIRNQIAHGRLRPDRIDVSAVVAEFYHIQSQLTR